MFQPQSNKKKEERGKGKKKKKEEKEEKEEKEGGEKKGKMFISLFLISKLPAMSYREGRSASVSHRDDTDDEDDD